mmetsp:Transcript_10640/g.13163  ORF Transcript_10640/g.13163 Transcript_10640/m.13163 type:complete len:185 (+) Transcript_10640:1183-1737(+)
MDVPDVKNVFRNAWSIEMFTRLVWSLQFDPKLVYKWIYEHIYGNTERKDLNFQKVIEENFGHKKLVELITMVHEQSITVANAKQVMMAIIDGDERMPAVIAEEQGFMGGPITTDEVRQAVDLALQDPKNAEVVKKVAGGNPRPVMSLVGQVMKGVNRRGDPVVIKKLLEEGIAKMGGVYTAPKG